MLIQVEQSIESEYNRLLAEERKLRLLLESGEAICLHCESPEDEHIARGDMRCDCYTTSRHFLCKEKPELKNVTKALELTESLKSLKGGE